MRVDADNFFIHLKEILLVFIKKMERGGNEIKRMCTINLQTLRAGKKSSRLARLKA